MMDFLWRLLGGSVRPSTRSKSKARVVPRLEALEERWVPTAATGAMSLQSLVGAGFTTLSSPPAATGAVTASTNSQGTMVGNGVIAPQIATFTPFKTGGSETQSVQQFNSSLGTLTSVQIILNGTLNSDVKVENLDAAPSTVNAQVNGTLSLQGAGISGLSVAPTITENSTSLSAYDGTLDYGGTSGHDFGEQSASAQQSITITDPTALQAWQGSGTVQLTEAAQSSSTVSGSGNEQVHICSEGSGTATVIYNFTPTPQVTPPPVTPPPTNCNPPPPTTTITPPPTTTITPPPPTNCNPPPPTTTITPPPTTTITPPPTNCNPPPPTTTITPPPSTTPPTTTTCTPPTGPASIEGIVYDDPNNAGHYAQGDTGVSGLTVTLTGTTLTNQQVNQTATTDANGNYSFTNLQAGVYTLSDQPLPSGDTAGAATLGSLGGVVSNGNLTLALPQGGDGMCYDFGLVPTPPPAVVVTPPPTTPPTPPPAVVVTPPPDIVVTPPPAVVVTPPPTPNVTVTPPPLPTIPFDPPLVLSKRSLIGNGWQSLG